jgi:hypothetical protein
MIAELSFPGRKVGRSSGKLTVNWLLVVCSTFVAQPQKTRTVNVVIDNNYTKKIVEYRYEIRYDRGFE